MDQEEIKKKAIEMNKNNESISKIYFFAKKNGANKEMLHDIKYTDGDFFKYY